ncbi:6-phosphofructokinase [Mycoplasma testudineum]|uniref:6-phosphofructokinase n=1 Tax=Mycoplasma testudineum TaxID=244584 RepID=A0A4R6IC24_9MOLU|nr:6-phosphofructokinase [Mycoplasma testudineum]OYD26521.1 6-phosphofructokinase [Mycoplasma testudineum]TDO19141.1 6-phosphofructokinase [Mycoplasma testudineum]
MKSKINKIAIMASGGDAPGMNSAIRAAVLQARAKDIEPYLVIEGYKGLVEDNIVLASKYDVNDYINVSGTFIYSARYPQFKDIEVRKIAKSNLDKRGIDALLVIGGDGSYQGAQKLHELAVKTVALPGTIDNDITSSDTTIGYDTALNSIVSAIDNIRSTAKSHNSCFIVETMGHGASDLALYSGIATGAELIVSNDLILSEDEVINKVDEIMNVNKHRSMIIVVSEFIFESVQNLAKKIQEKTKVNTRAVVLGHIQRGGIPSARERIDATRMATNAINYLAQGQSGIAIGIINGKTTAIPILEALAFKPDNKEALKKRTLKYSLLNSQKTR